MSNLVPLSARLVPPSACLVQSTGLILWRAHPSTVERGTFPHPTETMPRKAVFLASFPNSALRAIFLSGRVGSCQLEAPFTRLLSQPTFIPQPGSHARRPSHVAQYFVWIGMGSGPISLKPVQIFRHLHNHISNYRGPWTYIPLQPELDCLIPREDLSLCLPPGWLP